ncbi:hypothetical protein [Patulibacter minatonensis]|uniref:hypothetical protein n=1 Tax=Patulibacter minatonensis TaxID=298163 RepID=UPI00047A1FC7|nr:hypothetical protein [Patulibacter minatonensis]
MRSSIRRVLAVASVLVLVPSAAHAAKPVPVSGGVAGEVEAVSPDGTVLALDAGRKGGLKGAVVDGSGRPSVTTALGGWGGSSAVAASSPAGAAAVAAPSDGNDHLVVGLRAPGSPFAPFADLATTAASNTASSVAVAGGVVLAGGTASRSGSTTQEPVVLRRLADGTAPAPVVLPGPPGQGIDAFDVQVGVDDAGRGVVAWTTGAKAARRVQVATIAADGTLGTPVALPGVAPAGPYADQPSAVLVRVAPDGTGAVAWRSDGRTRVAPVSTTAGVDVSGAASVPMVGATALQPDGAAVVVSAKRSKGTVTARVAGRAAGKSFSAVRTKRGVRGGVVGVALARGRWVAAFATDPLGRDLHPSSLLTGDAGGVPSPVLGLPTASISQLSLRVAAPGGRPLAFARARREIEDRDGGVRQTGVRTETLRVAAGTPKRARASFSMASSQRIGRGKQTLRLRLTCRSACAYRVLGTVRVGTGGRFDVARTASRGTHTVRVPYQGESSGHEASKPLRVTKRSRIAIAVDDAAGGETIWRRTVTVRP